MNFVDFCKIRVVAGKGGSGIISFRHELFADKGGPDGGSGGNGGNIFFKTDSSVSSLQNLINKKTLKADDGNSGGSNNKTGKTAQDLVIKIPQYTKITFSTKKTIFADEKQKKYLIARGGNGGLGNKNFATSTNQIPMMYNDGLPGQDYDLTLEIELFCNVGIIGFPNSGKSTLINALTNTHSIIGNYPFTTLIPVLGSMNYNSKSIILGDLPGIIEGASSGKGLGTTFLRHIRHAGVLLILLDVYENPYEKYLLILKELKQAKIKVKKSQTLIVINKAEEIYNDDFCLKVKEQFKSKKIYFVSALKKEKLINLKKAIYAKNAKFESKIAIEKIEEKTDLTLIYNYDDSEIKVKEIKDNVFEVTGKQIKYYCDLIPLTTFQNKVRFFKSLRKLKLTNYLLNHNCKPNSKICMYSNEFEFKEIE